MESYRHVMAPLSCKRCHVETRFEVMFEAGPAGRDSWEVGQPVAPEDGFAPGESFRGTTSRYCNACFKQWLRTETTLRFRHMGDAIRDGKLTLRWQTSDRDITIDELVNYSAQVLAEIDEGHGAPPPPTQNWVDFECLWEGEDAGPGSPAGRACNAWLDERTETDLVRSGWRWGRNVQRNNLRVFVDASGMLRVEVMRVVSACPVCTLEPAFEEPYDACPRCRWYNDPIQRGNPEAFGTNLMTLNQARAAWSDGRPVR